MNWKEINKRHPLAQARISQEMNTGLLKEAKVLKLKKSNVVHAAIVEYLTKRKLLKP